MTRLTLDRAETIVAAAFAKGRELGLKPLSVAVLDAGGHLIAFARQDGASMLRPQIACGKASGALALGVSSRKIGDMAIDRPTSSVHSARFPRTASFRRPGGDHR